MKKLLFFFIAAFAFCLSLIATTDMCVKLNDGKIVKYNVKDVSEVFYVRNDSSAIDTSSTPLIFRITSDSTAEVIGYNSSSYIGALSIPKKAQIDGKSYTVTGIGDNAFRGCSTLTSVDFPESITKIGWDAFNGCIGLTSIKIPSRVTTLEVGLFNNCSNLAHVEIPEGVTTIENYAFHRCYSLNNVKLPKNVKSIGNSTFAWCNSLTGLDIPNSMTTLGNYAFHGCVGLTNMMLPSSVTDIRIYAFYLCENLDVVIDNTRDSVSVGSGAFEGCISVTFLKDKDSSAIVPPSTPLIFRRVVILL